MMAELIGVERVVRELKLFIAFAGLQQIGQHALEARCPSRIEDRHVEETVVLSKSGAVTASERIGHVLQLTAKVPQVIGGQAGTREFDRQSLERGSNLELFPHLRRRQPRDDGASPCAEMH